MGQADEIIRTVLQIVALLIALKAKDSPLRAPSYSSPDEANAGAGEVSAVRNPRHKVTTRYRLLPGTGFNFYLGLIQSIRHRYPILPVPGP